MKYRLLLAVGLLLGVVYGAAAQDFSGGLLIVVGAKSATLPAGIDLNNSVVQFLVADEADVKSYRAQIVRNKQSERVSVRSYDGKHLPFVDNSLNLLLIEAAQPQLSVAEIQRVLAPRGKLSVAEGIKLSGFDFVKEGGRLVYTKAVPSDGDEWPLYLHDAGNNAVSHDKHIAPPRQMQWVGGPLWTRNHHLLNSISSVVSSGGRIFYIVDKAPDYNLKVQGKWLLECRDAFNGVLLWERKINSWVDATAIRFRSGPPQLPRLLGSDDSHVYLPLDLDGPIEQVDAASGKTLQVYPETKHPAELLLDGDLLLVLRVAPGADKSKKPYSFLQGYTFPMQVVALRITDGKVLWKSEALESVRPETLAADARHVYLQTYRGVRAFVRNSGEQQWTFGDVKPAPAVDSKNSGHRRNRRKSSDYGKNVLVVSDDTVLFNTVGNMVVLDAASGKKLWQRKVAHYGFHAPLDVFVINGVVWLGAGRGDSGSPEPVNDFTTGLNLRTGSVVATNRASAFLQTIGHHHRCYREKATEKFVLAGKRGIEFIDLSGCGHSRNNWLRGTCQYGIMPANGLVYAPSHACGCYMESLLHGFWAVAPKGAEPPETKVRLKRGTAGRAFDAQYFAADLLPESWPTYRANCMRGDVVPMRIDAQKLVRQWDMRIGGQLTQPVAVGGLLVLADTQRGLVYAVDRDKSKVLWSFAAGGRVDSAPTIYGNRVFFGCSDGKVYAIDIKTGEEVWSFLCARHDRQAIAFDGLESVWPVHGSVLVQNGVLYASAGRSSWLDGGISLYALDPATGKVLSHSVEKSKHPSGCTPPDSEKANLFSRTYYQNKTDWKTFLQPDLSDSFSMAGGTRSDVLVGDGKNVFLHQLCFDENLVAGAFKQHLFSTSFLLDSHLNHRSHLFFGYGDFSRVPVAYSWIINQHGRNPWHSFTPSPYGVLLVFDAKNAWGVQRLSGRSDGTFSIFKQAVVHNSKSSNDFGKSKSGQASSFVWHIPLACKRPWALIRVGNVLVVGVEVEKGQGRLLLVDADSGKLIRSLNLSSPPVWDGISAANGRVYIALQDGMLVGLGEPSAAE